MTDLPAGRPTPRVADVVGVLAGAVAASLLAVVLVPLGTAVLYAIGGLVVVAGLAWAFRAELVPAWRAALDRARPQRIARPASGWNRTVVAVVTVGVVTATAFVAANLGTKGIAALTAVPALGVVVWLTWPLLHDLITSPPTDVPERPGRTVAASHRERRGVPVSVVLVAAAVAASVAAFLLAQLGTTALVAGLGAVVVVALLLVVRDRSVAFTFLAVASLALVLHKSFGPQDLEQSGGAVSIYVTTFDGMLVVLWALWWREGTLVTDLRAAYREHRLLWLPLAGLLLFLPSLFVAPSVGHAASELVRMVWMYLLFVYVAVRVRTRRHLFAVLGGLAVFAAIELVVVVLQWRTGGVLGLEFLGVPQTLTERTTDVSEIGRPFGTIIHPVFLGAVMGSLTLLCLALAITLERSLLKLVAAVGVLVCAVPLYLAHTRASVVAALLGAVYVVGVGLSRRQLQWATIGRFVVAGLVGVLVFLPPLRAKFSENFGTSHFWEEIQSRLQLNSIAGSMIDDRWGLGVGLNNFEVVLPRYESHFVIFFGNPVHNLYLLVLAETGIVGFVGFLAVGIGVFRAAFRATRTSDRLVSGVAVGVLGAFVFLAIEELLGFSLRQDIPLAVFWLFAGLVVVCTRLGRDAPPYRRSARRHPTPPAPTGGRAAAVHVAARRHPSASRSVPVERVQRVSGISRVGAGARRRIRLPRLPRVLARRVAAALLVAAAAAWLPVAGTARAETAPEPRVVLQATVRATGEEALFTVRPDGSGLQRITPADGRQYRWGRWVFGGREIVYTARRGGPGSPESIEMIDPDGRNRRVLAAFDFQVGQPQVDPTGRHLYFTAAAPWFPTYALFRMDLTTLESVNLTAVTEPAGGVDADPVLTPDGSRVLVASGQSERTELAFLDADGRHREQLTSSGYFNTDPDIAPDGRTVAVASYRGTGAPGVDDAAQTRDFHIVVHDVATGRETELTAGADCSGRPVEAPCTVREMSGYIPRFSADGSRIAFDGAMDRTTTCICTIGVDGSDPGVLFASTALAVNWFDLPGVRVAGPVGGDAVIGSAVRPSRVLAVLQPAAGGPAELVDASPDLVHREVVPLPDGLEPLQARWSPDRRQIVFTARVPVPSTPAAPHPAAPPGATRREHVTLADLDPVQIAMRAAQSGETPDDVAGEQVFLRAADGTVWQLTDPWTEDWMDGVREGDARGNSDPSFTPDGQAVLVTNRSTLTGESFVLRIDLRTGSVTNLTNATSGAVPVDDAAGTVSPDGRRVAFTWTDGASSEVWTMASDTGADVREVTRSDDPDFTPRWTPDGTAVVSTSIRDGASVVVRTGLDGRETVLSGPQQQPARDPVVVPEGDRVLFVGASVQTVSVWTVSPDGGTPRLLQADPTHQVLSVDGR